MTHALLCFAATFLAVFALGLQSLNVNQGHYVAAAATSLMIGVGHIALYKYMPGADLADIGAYLAGGVTGIVTSMWFHRVVKAWWTRWQTGTWSFKRTWHLFDPLRAEREARDADRRGYPGDHH